MEERFSRHQKLMRNRYSKLLRRRSIWEGSEHTQSPVWARSRRWLVTRWADKKALSYQRALQAGMQDPSRRTNNERPWKEWDRDFDKLKSRIDEEIDRDPYGALFGRHLRGPPSPNNSSWTSFSWIYGPLKSMQRDISSMSPDGTPDVTTSSITTSKPEERKTSSVPPRAPSTQSSQRSHSSRVSPVEPEYEFDPISMRKVPKTEERSPSRLQPTQAAPAAPLTNHTFLETLFFAEHGVDIPVKTYKRHKVYGYGASQAAESIPAAAQAPKKYGIDRENSRLRDIQALKFKTLGNSIDTAAEYGGKYKNPADPEPIHVTSAKRASDVQSSKEIPKRHDVKNISGDDNSALFAGTTYETEAKRIAATLTPKPSFKSSWLEKEGFRTLRQALTPSEPGAAKPDILTEVKVMPPASKIEPALDRVKASDVKLSNKREASMPRESSIPSDETEDLDLLRASDVRAATKSARMTRHEVEQGKQEARKKLETDYSKHQLLSATKSAINAEITKDKVSRRLSSVWEHMKQYPQGIVAKTIDGMGIFNDNYKKYERPFKLAQDSTEKLVFKDESLSQTPSIYKKVDKKSTMPLEPFTPSQEVVDVERAEKARITFVRQVNAEARNRALFESDQAKALAADIRNIYEQQYGKIDINHRQAAATSDGSADAVSASLPPRTDVTEFKKPVAALQPMGSATVKPGVKQDPVINDHVSVFEPKLAKLVDDAKSARKVIHEAKLEVMAMRSRRPQTIWSGRSTEAASNDMVKPETICIEPALDRSRLTSEGITKPAESVSIPRYISEYIILAYDALDNAVTASPLDSSMLLAQESERQTGVPQILASLNHTAKFLSHFASLSNQGYEVVSGGGDVLLFKKRSAKVADPPTSPLLTHVRAVIDKNKLAAQEASAQPIAKVVPVEPAVDHGSLPMKEAATVLDEIPASEPRPGPAGPTAPTMGPPSHMRPKVRRQEDVFSASQASRVSAPPAASTAKKVWEGDAREAPKIRDGLWTRFKRGVKRVVLTAVAMGVGAYTIGAVAESLGAQHPTPLERAIRSGRPGMYSTENSR